MTILSFHNLRQSFAEVDIFSGLTASIPPKARIGIVGPNGIGKTTLLRILAGVTSPKEGSVQIAKGTRLGYLRQEAIDAFANRDHSVYKEMLTVFTDLRKQAGRLQALEMALSEDYSEALLAQYGKAQEAFEMAGGYDYELRIKQVLDGLGFKAAQLDMPLSHCSGGQKTRALMARLLLEKPDLLILDEPTNHLDIAAVEWLESALRIWEGSILIVSHDRYFLDRVVDNIWEMSRQGIELYRGNYSNYVLQREIRWARREDEFRTAKENFLKELDYVKRNIARDSSTDMAKGRLKRLIRAVKAVEVGGIQALNQSWLQFTAEGPGITGEKWGVAEVESRIKALRSPSPRHKQIVMRFTCDKHISHSVLQAKEVVIGYPDTPLFKAERIDLYKQQCVALIGPNGTGKTTFLRTLLGELKPLAGRLELGAGGVEPTISYFAQAHDELNPDNRVVDEFINHYNMLPGRARDYLGRYLFEGEDVFKPVRALSGGERGRLALAILAYPITTFLVLDEPANHLDIAAQEVLQDAIQHFEGTVLLVTHDRYLVDKLATQIWEVKQERLHIHQGDYQSYLEARDAAQQKAKQARATSKSKKQKSSQAEAEAKRMAKAIAKAEDEIQGLEETLEQVGLDLEAASQAQDWEKMQALSKQYKETETALEAKMEAWETLSAEG